MNKANKEKLQRVIQEGAEAALLEYRKKNVVITINGEEMPFGSEKHLGDLNQTLMGLERLRDCFEVGSGNRLTYSQACSRLRKLIRDLTEKVTQIETELKTES